MVEVSALHRTLDQELVALLRGVSLECPVCGEFVLHTKGAIACPECRSILAHGVEVPAILDVFRVEATSG
jgi:Zn finger protein HypA/HybF involved in hydrogenase expression